MKYQDAIRLGNGLAYGEVKCTYTLLYSEKGLKSLFSVTRVDTEYGGAFYRIYEDARLKSGQGVEKHDLLPIVYSDEADLTSIDLAKRDDRRIRVRFTEEFRIGLEDYINDIKERKLYRLIMKYKKDDVDAAGTVRHKKGQEVVLDETYDYVDIASENAYYKKAYADNALRYCYWVEATKELKDRYKELLRIATENDYIYVMARNLDWTPADMVITFVDDRNTMASYEAQLNAAKEKVEQARKLLIASGLASLII